MGAWVSAASDAVVAGAALAGVIVAFLGLQTWKTQLRKGGDHELARSLLVRLFQYRDAIRQVRNPFMSIHEMTPPAADQSNKMSPEQIHHYGVTAAYRGRWTKVREAREQLYPLQLEANALWGKDLDNLFRPVEKLERELFVASDVQLKSEDPSSSQSMRDAYYKISKERRDVLYAIDGKDPFDNQLEMAFEAIEAYLKPKLV